MAECCPHCGEVHARGDLQGSGSEAAGSGTQVVTDHTALLTGDDNARWNALAPQGGGAVVTYRFYDEGSMPSHHAVGPGFENDGFKAFDWQQKQSFRRALDEVSDQSGILFVELDAGDSRAMIGVNRTVGSNWGGWANYPYVNGSYVGAAGLTIDGDGSFAPGTWAFEIILHEIGHAVGLKHPFDTGSSNQRVLAGHLDDTGNTVMSYSSAGGPQSELGELDVKALRALYGGPGKTRDWQVEVREDALRLVGGGRDDVMTNPGGDFVLHGRGGDDRLIGTDGQDVQHGGSGRDRLDGGGRDDTLHGGRGADRITGGRGADTIDGGDGSDRIDGDEDGLPNGVAGAGDTIRGGRGSDVIDGGEGGDRLFGDAHGDRLLGRSGDDVARGGAGEDTVDGGAGNDRLRGDGGADEVYGRSGDDRMFGGGGNDRLEGGGGTDGLYGGDGRDVLRGGAGHDSLVGARGRDRLFGEDGDDELLGGAGADVLSGGRGADWIEGGRGGDVLTGGAGRDVFVFGPDADAPAVDTITDWQSALDRIDLAGIDGGGAGGPRAFERADGDVMLRYGDFRLRVEDADAADFGADSFLL